MASRMTCRVVAVVEDTVCTKGLWAEEGFAVAMHLAGEGETHLLLDCGRSGEVALHNLKALGLRQVAVSAIVLSHGHSGHVGGASALADSWPDARLIEA